MDMRPLDSFFGAETPSFATDAQAPRTSGISSAELLANGKLVRMQPRGELHSSHETRLGKLILTK